MKGSGILTDVSGVGSKTATEINELFGFTTPKELYVSYLKGEKQFNTTIMELIRDKDKLHTEIMNKARHGIVTNEDILDYGGKSTEFVKAMLFVRIFGVSSRSLTSGHDSSRSNTDYRAKYIDVSDGHIITRSYTTAFVFNEERISESDGCPNLEKIETTANDSDLHAEEVATFYSNDSNRVEYVSMPILKNINKLYGGNLPYQGVHRVETASMYSDYPVKIPDVQNETFIVVAPRIIDND